MQSHAPPLEHACLFPRFEQLTLYADQHPQLTFSEVLQEFAECAELHPHYFFGDVHAMCCLADILEHLPLSLAERWVIN